MGIAPVVYCQSSFFHSFFLDIWQKLFLQKPPAAIRFLGIDPMIQHIREKDLLGDRLCVIQLFQCL